MKEIEIVCDIYDYLRNITNRGEKVALIIPTNSTLTNKGLGIMGAGLALRAKQMIKFPKEIDPCKQLSMIIKEKQNVGWLGDCFCIKNFAFMTKDNFRNPSRIEIIKESAKQLRMLALIEYPDIKKWYLPHVGCGLGGLEWRDVGDMLHMMLDDRFIAFGYC